MTHPVAKRIKKLYAPAREILMQHWDPIGVAGIPEAVDEYDSYIPGAISVISRGGDARAVAKYLDRIAAERMELMVLDPTGEPSAQAAAAAIELVALWQTHMGPRR